MVKFIALALAAVATDAAVVNLDQASFTTAIAEGAFVKFFAPWCGHCKKLKPDWDKLGMEYTGKAVIGDVDCTVEKALCSTYDVKGFPTLKWFAAGSDTANDYEGGRTFSDIKTFADGSLGPQCGSKNKDLCSEAELKNIEDLEALGKDEIEKRIKEGTDAASTAEEIFEAALKDLQATYERISKEKEEAVSAAKAPLALLKSISFE